jgi:hypothetical protein
MKESEDNIFRILGVQGREDAVSNALAYAINNSAAFRNDFLSDICDKNPGLYRDCRAYTRVSSAHGIPDIVLVCSSNSGADLVIIEQKLKADEGEDQTERYATPDSVKSLRQRLCPHLNGEASFVFLTLFPDQEPQSSLYRPKNHSALVHLLPKYVGKTSLAEILIYDWLSLVDKFYKKDTVLSSDNILSMLQDDEGLESGYLYFRRIFSSLSLPPDMEIDEFFRASRQGRRYYGAKISKPSWHPEEMAQRDGVWQLDGGTNFHIHFEAQYDVLRQSMRVYLHYEIYPYQPEHWVVENVIHEEYSAYRQRRQKFADRLRAENPRGWVISIGFNQIARAEVDFSGQTSGLVREDFEALVRGLTPVVDAVLGSL